MTGGWSRDPRLVRAAVRAENVVQRATASALRAAGRHTPLILPFLGYGSGVRGHIGARIVFGGRSAASRRRTVPLARVPVPVDTDPDAVVDRRSRRALLRSSLSRFLTVEVPHVDVDVDVAGRTTRVSADREGYVDAVIDLPGLDPGWHEVDVTLPGGDRATTGLLVVDPRADVAIVSDVDDTVLETGLTRGLAFLQVTLLTHVSERAPLPGAAALYRALTAGRATDGERAPDGGDVVRPVFYVSTSPWNLHGMLLQFLALRHFPLGPLLLTDWGPGHGSLFRIGAQEHKVGLIRRLLAEYPSLQLVLVGDSGQRDPEIYADVARSAPERIRAVYIRRTPHALPGRTSAVEALAAAVTGIGVPMLAVDDSVEIARHAASIGLLDEAAVAAVAAETGRHA